VHGELFSINYHGHHHDVVLTALAPPPAPGWHPPDPAADHLGTAHVHSGDLLFA